MPPFASVIIPYFDAAATLPETLASLARQHCREPWEVVIADNEGSSVLVAMTASYRPALDIRIVDASDRRGAAHALNAGARAARGDALLFCDADDMPGDGWLRAMLAGLHRHDAVAARWDIKRLNPPSLRRSRGNPQARGLQPWTKPAFLPHASGGSLGVRRRVHEIVGDFDESLIIVYDTDYCWRLQLAGFELGFAPDAVMHMRFREPRDGMFHQARRYGRGSVVLYARYRDRGMAPARVWDGVRAWAVLALRSQRILRSGARPRWVWKLGYRFGRLTGSVEDRVMFL